MRAFSRRGSLPTIAALSVFHPNFVFIVETATFWGYCAIAIGVLAFVCYLMPETKGRSLEEIEVDLSGKQSPKQATRNKLAWIRGRSDREIARLELQCNMVHTLIADPRILKGKISGSTTQRTTP